MTDSLLLVETARVQSLCAEVRAYPIRGQADLDELAAATRTAKARLVELEAARKDRTRPLQEETKRIQAEYKAPETAYAALLEACKDRIERHRDETRALQQAQQAEAARLFQVAQTTGQAELAQVAHAALAAAPAPAAAEGISFRKSWQFKITDEAAVPRDLCSPDPAKIREWVKAGGRMAPGIYVFEQETAAVRT